MSNIGIGDSSLRFMTGTDDWEVVRWDGRFAVCKFSNERMRITSDGQVLFGETLRTPDNAVAVYWFNTQEWANLARRRLTMIDRIPAEIAYQSVRPVEWAYTNPSYRMTTQPEHSTWQCYLFGNTPGGPGMVYTPEKGKEPNRFVRYMMKVMLASTWINTERKP